MIFQKNGTDPIEFLAEPSDDEECDACLMCPHCDWHAFDGEEMRQHIDYDHYEPEPSDWDDPWL